MMRANGQDPVSQSILCPVLIGRESERALLEDRLRRAVVRVPTKWPTHSEVMAHPRSEAAERPTRGLV